MFQQTNLKLYSSASWSAHHNALHPSINHDPLYTSTDSQLTNPNALNKSCAICHPPHTPIIASSFANRIILRYATHHHAFNTLWATNERIPFVGGSQSKHKHATAILCTTSNTFHTKPTQWKRAPSSVRPVKPFIQSQHSESGRLWTAHSILFIRETRCGPLKDVYGVREDCRGSPK